MSVVFVRRWLVAFFIAIGIILIVTLSLRKVSFLTKVFRRSVGFILRWKFDRKLSKFSEILERNFLVDGSCDDYSTRH